MMEQERIARYTDLYNYKTKTTPKKLYTMMIWTNIQR